MKIHETRKLFWGSGPLEYHLRTIVDLDDGTRYSILGDRTHVLKIVKRLHPEEYRKWFMEQSFLVRMRIRFSSFMDY